MPAPPIGSRSIFLLQQARAEGSAGPPHPPDQPQPGPRRGGKGCGCRLGQSTGMSKGCMLHLAAFGVCMTRLCQSALQCIKTGVTGHAWLSMEAVTPTNLVYVRSSRTKGNMHPTPTVLKKKMSCLGLLLGTEAPVITPNGIDVSCFLCRQAS